MKLIEIYLHKRINAVLLGSIILFASCTKSYKDINVDKNSIVTLGPAQLPFLFSQALEAAPNSFYNYQIAQNLFADQYCQYFACEATYFPSDRLTIRQDWVGAQFNPMYTNVMPQLQSIFSATDSTSPEYQMASVWWRYISSSSRPLPRGPVTRDYRRAYQSHWLECATHLPKALSEQVLLRVLDQNADWPWGDRRCCHCG